MGFPFGANSDSTWMLDRRPASMAKPLDKDLRIRIVAAIEGGMSRRAAARHFGVSESAAIKLMRRYRATGSVEPGKMGGHRQPVLQSERDWVLARIAEEPDITLRALAVPANLGDDGTLTIEIKFHHGDEATLKARRW